MDLARYFLEPANPTHRQYEALRAHFVDNLTMQDAAQRFGYALGSFQNLCAEFRKNPRRPFFLVRKRGPKPETRSERQAARRKRILELRKEENLSVTEIAERLAGEGRPASVTTVARVLQKEGVPKLWRRSAEERAAARPSPISPRSTSRPGASAPTSAACSCSPTTSPGSASTRCSRPAACRAAP